MYLPPGALKQDLSVERPSVTTSDGRGGAQVTWSSVLTTKGVISDSGGRRSPWRGGEIRFGQEIHPITHEVVIEGAVDVRSGDRIIWGTRKLYVLAALDPGGLGMYTLVACEERRDGN